MDEIRQFLNRLINISDDEFDNFICYATVRKIKRKEVLNQSGKVPTEIFFIISGAVRQFIVDNKGNEQTLHFAFENSVVGDYINMTRRAPSITTFQAIEDTDVFVFPSTAIEWALRNLTEGLNLGEFMSVNTISYLENRLIDIYLRTPKERYDNITKLFPDIHNRVPQHMIASYLGITSVHLSRLKNPK